MPKYECDKEHNQFKNEVRFDMLNSKTKASIICCYIKTNNYNRKLDLSFLKICSEAAKTIASAIQGNTSLKELDISNNTIADNGGLQINITLQVLNMSHYNISYNGAVAISECLKNI